MKIPKSLQPAKNVFVEFVRDDALTLSAGIAFYSALSFAPIMILLVMITAALSPDIQQGVVDQINKLMGDEASSSVDAIIDYARDRDNDLTLTGIAGVGVLAFSATAVFAQLQAALNRVWDVRPKPGRGLWSWMRKRMLSAGMIVALLFLLLVSLVVDATLAFFIKTDEGVIGQVINTAVSVIVFAMIFTVMFWYLPDVKVRVRDVMIGAVVTAVLFIIGKYLIGLYLGRSTLASAYGAAGSLVVLLLWVYYSAAIFLFGAEVTQEITRRFGPGIRPDEHAVPVKVVRKESAQAPPDDSEEKK